MLVESRWLPGLSRALAMVVGGSVVFADGEAARVGSLEAQRGG